MEHLKIEYLPIDSLKPYEGNAKEHPQEQIDQIIESIRQFGMNDPIAIYGDEHLIVEGHGRLLALQQMGAEEAPTIRLDHMTDEQRRAYTLVHNKTTMNSGFDMEILVDELESLDIDMGVFGFDLSEMQIEDDSPEEDANSDANTEKYTNKVNIPQYEITGEQPSLKELADISKQNELIREIESASIPDEEKEFLKLAASRHTVFDYGKIAEYYAHADKTMQELIEKSALVIIDIDDAIKYGFARLSERFEQIEVLDSEG
jgi:hypothetical protein